MLFRRRKPADFRQRVHVALWPRRSFARSMQYFAKRVLRLSATPHAIAAGVACGVFATFLPYFGFHFILAALLAFCIRGNIVAAAVGTAIGNPLTFPFIWGGTLALGRLVLDGRHPESVEPLPIGRLLMELDFEHMWQPLLKPMTVGGGILGALFGLVFYLTTCWAVAAFQEQRRLRLAERARRRAAPAGFGG